MRPQLGLSCFVLLFGCFVITASTKTTTEIRSFKALNEILRSFGSNTIPSEIGSLTSLTVLDLSGSNIQGKIPTELGELTKLEYASLRDNYLSGPIPSQLKSLTNLETLYLSDNELTGEVDLEGLVNLRFLRLANNLLTYVHKIGSLTNLASVTLHNNQLLQVPEGIAKLLNLENLTEIGLVGLNLANNNLTQWGPTESSDGDELVLEYLDLSNNRFSQIPDSPELYKLEHLILSSNNITDVSPLTISKYTLLRELRLNNNMITTLPSELGQLASIEQLWIAQTNITCDCRLKNWIEPFLNRRFDHKLINADATLCADVNEFAGFPVYLLDMHPDQPCSHPRNISSNITESSFYVDWEYDSAAFGEEDVETGPKTAPWECESLPRREDFPNFPSTTPMLAYRVEWAGEEVEGSLCTWTPGLNVTNLEPYQEYTFTVQVLHVRFDYDRIFPKGDVGIGKALYAPRFSGGPRSSKTIVRTAPSLPPSVEHVQIKEIKEDNFLLSWARPSRPRGEIIAYEIKVANQRYTEDSNATFKLIAGLTARTTYVVHLRGRTRVGPGPWKTVMVTTLAECPAGRERATQDGKYQCIPCPIDYYKSHADSRCIKCPSEFPVTHTEGTVSQEGCRTGPGYVRVKNQALACGEVQGIDCKDRTGLNITNVPIVSGYWRVSDRSLDVKLCPEPSFCSSSMNGRLLQDSVLSRSCFGDGCCNDFHRGVFCVSCVDNYALKSNGCVRCSRELEQHDRNLFTMWVVLGILLALVFPCRLVYVAFDLKLGCRSKHPTGEVGLFQKVQRLTEFCKRSLGAKFRIALAFYQVLFIYVATEQHRHFGPAGGGAFAGLVNLDFSWLFDLFTLGCYKQVNFYDRLLLYTLYPLAFMLFTSLVFFVIVKCSGKIPAKAAKEMMSVFLHLLFVIYPGVSSAIVSVFLYERFPHFDGATTEVTYTLRKDYTVNYDSPRSQVFKVYAGVMVLVYPVGVVFLFFGMAAYSRRHDQDQYIIASASRFLYRNFHPKFYWFESWELVRKLCCTAIIIVINQHDPRVSKTVFCAFVMVAIVVLLKCEPYVRGADQTLALLSQALLFVMYEVSSVDHNADVVLLVIVLSSLELVFFAAALAWDVNKLVKLRRQEKMQAKTSCGEERGASGETCTSLEFDNTGSRKADTSTCTNTTTASVV